jgi:hypothetical protein
VPQRRVQVIIEGENLSRAAFEELRRDLAGVGPTSDRASSALSGFFGGMGRIGGLTTAVGMGVFAFQQLKQAVDELGSSMFAGNREFENYSVQFGVLLKSAASAKSRIAELERFNLATPFQLPEIVRADKVMTGFGLHSKEAAKAFGYSGQEIRRISADVAAGTGAAMESISMYVGRFAQGQVGEAMERFAELGVVTRGELAKMGVQFSKSGELVSPIEKAMNALLAVMDEKFKGMAEAQSRTFDGMLSNIGDWQASAQRRLQEPLFTVAKWQLQDFLNLLGSNEANNAVDSLADSITVAVFTGIVPAFQTAAQAAKEFRDSLAKPDDGTGKSWADQLVEWDRQFQEFQRRMTGRPAKGEFKWIDWPEADRQKTIAFLERLGAAWEAYQEKASKTPPKSPIWDYEAWGVDPLHRALDAAGQKLGEFTGRLDRAAPAFEPVARGIRAVEDPLLFLPAVAADAGAAIDGLEDPIARIGRTMEENQAKAWGYVNAMRAIREVERSPEKYFDPWMVHYGIEPPKPGQPSSSGGGPVWTPPSFGAGASTGKSPAERALDGIKDSASLAKEELQRLQKGLDEVLSAPLKGEGASNKLIKDLSEQIEAAKLKQMELVRAKAPGAERVAVSRDIKRLEDDLKLAQQRATVTFNPQRRMIEEAFKPQRGEASAAEIMSAGQWVQAQIGRADTTVQALEAAVRIAEAGAGKTTNVTVTFQNGSVQVTGDAPADVRSLVEQAAREAYSGFSQRLLASALRTQIPAPALSPGAG